MQKANVFSDSFFAMGTRCDVVLTDIEDEQAERIFQIIKTEIEDLEFLMSRFIYESPVSQLNCTEKNKWVTVKESTLWEVLIICYDFWQMSNGAFDITAAPVISLWKNKAFNEVTSEEIENAMKISGFDKVAFDFENHRIQFLDDGIEFDLGAIGKGIAIDSIRLVMEKQGVKNGIISFGESSILALGSHPNGEKWPLGIRNPFEPEKYFHVFMTQNATVTTSGTMISSDDGYTIKRNHIVSPATGYPVETDKIISILSESATLGEFLSTTLLILPENDRNLLIEKMKHIEILEVEFSEEKEQNTKLTLL